MEGTSNKLSWSEMMNYLYNRNKLRGVHTQYGDEKPLSVVAVFSNDSWPNRKEDYSLESRSYRFRSDEKHFVPGMMGNSVFADSLDGSDRGVRLDYYLGDWKCEYCYVEGGVE